jgi:segregation and condensation protein A
VVAAKLIYLKSKALLPTIQLEDDGIDLDKQLKMYKLYLDATKRLEHLIALKNFNFAREKYPTGLIEGFNPPKKISLERMQQIFDLLIRRLEPILVLPKKQIERVVSIREKIQHIRDSVLRQATTSFCKLVGANAGKLERIVSFLAILELVKQRIIMVDQEEHLSDISISKQEGAEHLMLDTNSEFI